ncbi:hypothetical protein L2E82_13824 [Cichorium intybus]|uniref:Uncharacterized protein n=1 Tax=Cichorium intybus TaxID=13427 RepID=A0ACB9EZJ4_CICIN|nr:hypothetical protein L1887_33466 [Cichorium endivia]KAI3763827.1 hypothetical protein L2E82_13824 [Cichorium intybus]
MERSKSLHNFSLPPGLTWGRQRFLRCMNVNPIRTMPAVDDDESSDSEEYNKNHSIENRHAEVEELQRTITGGRSSDDRRKRVRFNLKPLSISPSPAPEIGSVMKAMSEDEDEISVTREKLVMDFQTEVGKLKEAILQKNTSDNEIPPLENAEENSPPVNLKTNQKSTCSMPPPDAICTEGGGKGINAAVDDLTSEKKLTRPKRNLEKKEERAKFSIALSRKEIEDDFITMIGKKPPRKPNKRPKNVQNDLQGIYPGSRLCEVHRDLYK